MRGLFGGDDVDDDDDDDDLYDYKYGYDYDDYDHYYHTATPEYCCCDCHSSYYIQLLLLRPPVICFHLILTKENVEGKAREKTPEELRLEADRQTPGKVYRVVLQSVASGLFWGCIRVGGFSFRGWLITSVFQDCTEPRAEHLISGFMSDYSHPT